MENTSVVIVGAGPAGLTLSLCLAKHEVHSIILEKERHITEDPRGVALVGDAVRIQHHIGIGDRMPEFGQALQKIEFHKTTFRAAPFFTIPTGDDSIEQTVPHTYMQIQPKYERALRDAVNESPFCELRSGCKVIAQEEIADGVIVEYEGLDSRSSKIQCAWLIGADGKTGVVRKHFLEPVADIRQSNGIFEYNGTWIAANLHIKLPTRETHPSFPAWELGMTSDEVYDLFWPTGWHFCSPPGKPTATGRFGPVADRFWRHEFAEPDWDSSKDSEELLWNHLTPMITTSEDKQGRPFPGGPVTFPRDCVEVRRCRPFTFAHKVVNKWFHNRTILIGDAAHVFPPFGGQGIASGVRDAVGLAWRLALLQRLAGASRTPRLATEMLNTWSLERRKGIDNAAVETMINGKLANEEVSDIDALTGLTAKADSNSVPSWSKINSPLAAGDRAGYRAVKNGFFLSSYGGGGKLAQVYLAGVQSRPILSDQILRLSGSVLTLIVVTDSENYAGDAAAAENAIELSGVDRSVVSRESLVFVAHERQTSSHSTSHGSESPHIYYPCPADELTEGTTRDGYDRTAYLGRLGENVKYALIRPDFIIFSVARTEEELIQCLQELLARTAS